MPSEHEIPLLIRRFRGVDISQDPAFIGSDVLALSDSFAPNPLLVLAKRQGQTLYRQVVVDRPDLFSLGGIQMLTFLRTYDDVGNRYVIVVGNSTAGSSATVTSLNDAAFLFLISGFGRHTQVSLAQLGNRVYVGNDTDRIYAVVLGSPVTVDTSPFEITASGSSGGGTTGSAPTINAADANSQIVDGTYSFAWAVYNVVTKRWTRRYDTQTFQDTQVGDHSFSFTAPAPALLANELYHLFVAPVNQPIELASDQSPQGVVAGTGAGAPATAVVVIRQVTVDGTPLPLVGASRRGSLVFAHRNRLWVSGDPTVGNGSRVYATSIILPGNEQSIFDQQPYFPQNAVLNVGRQDGDRVTAIGRAALTVTTQSPDSPLLIFKNTNLWAFFGDILDDPSAALIQLSAEIGCPAPNTIVETPIGTVFLGLDSVYLVRPDQLIPFDLGFPIAPAIRAIPVALRPSCAAVYHRGFYKLAIPTFNGTGNTTQWWLDLRRAADRSLSRDPAWWGPHSTPSVVLFSNARQDTAELDRAMQLQTKGNIGLLDQSGVYTDLVDDVTGTTTQPVRSKLRTSTLDSGAPFDRKTWKRLRAIARTDTNTTISVNVSLEDGSPVMAETLVYSGTTTSVWDTPWDVPWSSGVFGEAESIFTDDGFRQPKRTAAIELAHTDAAALAIHDVEVRYDPVTRPVA